MHVYTKRHIHKCLFIVASDLEHPKCPATGDWQTQIVAYLYNRILCSNKKEPTTDTQNILDTSHRYVVA